MKVWSKQFWWSFFGVLALAATIRLYQLGNIPHGFTWDEAAIGYNGYAILTTRHDEWLVRLPISFRSFGDYKAPLAIYLNGFFTYVFGLTPFGVRLPFALAGVAAIAGWMLLQIDLRLFKKHATELALISGLLLALNPWHIHYSRIAFESGLSLAFVVWGWWLLVQTVRSEKKLKLLGLSFCSAVMLVASLYTYHSAKIVVPLMTIVVFLFAVKPSKKSFLRLLPVGVLSVLFVIPLVKDSLFGPGATRAGVLLFNQDLTLPELLQAISDNAIAQFSPAFLLLGKNITTLRDGGGVWGFLHPTTYVLSLVAIPLSIWQKKRSRALIFASILTVIGSLPAILATEAPHSNRGLFAVLGLILLAIVGAKLFLQFITKYGQLLQKTVLSLLVLLHLIFFLAYWQKYTVEFTSASAAAFQDGSIEAFTIAHQYELGSNGKQKVDQIIFISEYGQPYIYGLFVRKTDPIWYQGGSLNTYQFTDSISIGDLHRVNTLVVATPSQNLPVEQADHIITGSDGSTRFEMYVTK